ncbi:hypothetical protein AVEN_40344-1 [Araneus ventricosus]|uniref:Uncharacterized protein n=1 Tax=Araneus ventricosus TaxID=182803 RepID=A0A4Y2F1Y7_ARAVE|nr:hypothetical protein AVEN_40344-1 [Araneus ventricosus]
MRISLILNLENPPYPSPPPPIHFLFIVPGLPTHDESCGSDEFIGCNPRAGVIRQRVGSHKGQDKGPHIRIVDGNLDDQSSHNW